MKQVILDTNVGLVAMGAFEADGGKPTAKLKAWCTDEVAKIMRKELRLVVDAEREIVNEYLHKMPHFPLGDQFILWLSQNMWRNQDTTVDRVSITKTKDSYAEFPSDPRLDEFDLSDRKFVAVAVANEGQAAILEATDGKWWKWARPLGGYGVRVEFGDEAFVKSLCQKKNACKGACAKCNG